MLGSASKNTLILITLQYLNRAQIEPVNLTSVPQKNVPSTVVIYYCAW